MVSKNMLAGIPISRIGRLPGIKFLAAAVLLLGMVAPIYADTVNPSLIGHFSNQVWSKGEDPHAVSGYALDLYKQGDLFFGKIGVATGSPEPVGAKLYDISFNEKAKTISFKANYSEGRRFGRDIPLHKQDVKVILSFVGTLSARGIRGEFVHRDGYPPHDVVGKKRALLVKQNNNYVPANLEEWNRLFGD